MEFDELGLGDPTGLGRLPISDVCTGESLVSAHSYCAAMPESMSIKALPTWVPTHPILAPMKWRDVAAELGSRPGYREARPTGYPRTLSSYSDLTRRMR